MIHWSQELGGSKVHGAPQPPDWGGLCPLCPPGSAAYDGLLPGDLAFDFCRDLYQLLILRQ